MGPEDLFLLTLACGLAAVNAVDEVAGVRPGLKWPNDLVVAAGPLADRKLAGILAESHVVNGQVDAVVVGMGLNLDWPEELPEELAATAASVNHLTGESVDREEVLVAWLRHYDRHLASIADVQKRAGFLDEVRAVSATLGRDVRVESTTTAFEGQAVAIADDGRLLVECDGEVVAVTVGDGVNVGVAVGVGVGVRVGVAVTVGVGVTVGVTVGVGVIVGVAVGVTVGVTVGVALGVAVGVGVGVALLS